MLFLSIGSPIWVIFSVTISTMAMIWFGVLVRKANCILRRFSCADCVVKTNLFRSFCPSLYSSAMWNLSCKSTHIVEVSLISEAPLISLPLPPKPRLEVWWVVAWIERHAGSRKCPAPLALPPLEVAPPDNVNCLGEDGRGNIYFQLYPNHSQWRPPRPPLEVPNYL